MAQLKDLRKALLEQLAHNLAPKGFKYMKPQEYYRDTTTTRESFHIGFINHKTDFDVVVYIGLRCKPLIELLDKVAPMLTKQEKVHISAVGNELGNLTQVGQKRWEVSSEVDISKVTADILSAFETFALPYWERFSSLEEILAVTAGDDRASWIHSPFDGTRAETAITAAFVLGKKDVFEDIVKHKTQLLKDRHDINFQSFATLADTLAKNWPA